jgi:hypothetical protein
VPAQDALGHSGAVFNASNPNGIVRPDGAFFRIGDPLSSIESLNTVNPNLPFLLGAIASPRLEQPYTRQANLGWAHELSGAMSFSADYVRADGREITARLRPNVLVNGRRAFADLAIQPNASTFRTMISGGNSNYDALILALRRRLSRGFDLNAWYTLAKATSTIGPAYDELDSGQVQDINDPFGDVQNGPSARTDARHRVTLTAIVQAPWRFQVAPVFIYVSALPVHTIEGLDLNGDGNTIDRTAMAYRFTGLNDDGSATFEEAGPCKTVNCSRRAPFSQLNLRVSRSFALPRGARLEGIAEVFNLFNAKNPFIPLSTIRRSATNPALSSFMQPTAFAGDFQQPEQRVGQIGFRITF